MKYQFIFASSSEERVLEIDTNDPPPNVGDVVQLPFGKDKEMCHYRATDVYYTPVSPEKIVYYIGVDPA